MLKPWIQVLAWHLDVKMWIPWAQLSIMAQPLNMMRTSKGVLSFSFGIQSLTELWSWLARLSSRHCDAPLMSSQHKTMSYKRLTCCVAKMCCVVALGKHDVPVCFPFRSASVHFISPMSLFSHHWASIWSWKTWLNRSKPIWAHWLKCDLRHHRFISAGFCSITICLCIFLKRKR